MVDHTGSIGSPIIISDDEEDAAFVDRQLQYDDELEAHTPSPLRWRSSDAHRAHSWSEGREETISDNRTNLADLETGKGDNDVLPGTRYVQDSESDNGMHTTHAGLA